MDLKELLADHQTGMSEFQHDNLVTKRAGGTLYGQYKQSLRELYRRLRGLREIVCNRERMIVDIDELEEKIKSEKCGFEARRAMIGLTEKTMQLEEADRVLENTQREFNRFYQQAVALKGLIGDLTPEKRERYEHELWEFRIKEMAVIDLICNGRLRNVTYEFFQSAPADMKKRIAEALKAKGGLIEWYENENKNYLPQGISNIKTPDIRLDGRMLEQLAEIA